MVGDDHRVIGAPGIDDRERDRAAGVRTVDPIRVPVGVGLGGGDERDVDPHLTARHRPPAAAVGTEDRGFTQLPALRDERPDRAVQRALDPGEDPLLDVADEGLVAGEEGGGEQPQVPDPQLGTGIDDLEDEPVPIAEAVVEGDRHPIAEARAADGLLQGRGDLVRPGADRLQRPPARRPAGTVTNAP